MSNFLLGGRFQEYNDPSGNLLIALNRDGSINAASIVFADGTSLSSASSVAPGGVTTDVQFNNGGAFGGSGLFTFASSGPQTKWDISGTFGTGASVTIGRSSGGGEDCLEIHTDFADGLSMYTHADAEFRAPYINLFKSRGTLLNPTPVLFTGYESDSIGGINFGGWDGVQYFSSGAAIYSQSDENWSPTHHGAHISIYHTGNGSGSTNQVAQFGGLDPSGLGGSSIIFYRELVWNGNGAGNPAIYPSSNPGVLSFRSGANDRDIAITSSTLRLSAVAPTVSSGQLGLGATTAATASAGGGQATPGTVLGYLIANVAGVSVKIPYFAG